MLKIYTHLDEFKRVTDTAQRRKEAIKEQIRELQNEADLWDIILSKFKPCDKCKGIGELVYSRGMDGQKRETCPKCAGSGKAH
jgi:hypothetical protein